MLTSLLLVFLYQGTINNGWVGQTAANQQHIYVLVDSGDECPEKHGKIAFSKPVKDESKLSFVYNVSAPAMTQIAVADDFVLGLCEENSLVYRFDASLETAKAIAVSNIFAVSDNSGDNNPIFRITTMGASKDLAFFIAEVDDEVDDEDGAKPPANKKMKMTPMTGATD